MVDKTEESRAWCRRTGTKLEEVNSSVNGSDKHCGLQDVDTFTHACGCSSHETFARST